MFYRVATGDAEGRVVIWDVHTGQPTAALEDPWLAATGRRGDGQSKAAGVQALAWVLPNPSKLAIALSNILVIWDPEGLAPLQEPSRLSICLERTDDPHISLMAV